MGAACSLKGCMEFLFKRHYKRQMTKLMNKIIADASRDGHPSMEDTTREANFKKQMVYIRGLANSWDNLTYVCAHGIEPPGVMIKQVLDMMCESQSPFGITDLLCTCTYVTDVCTVLVKKSKEYDPDDKIVEMFIDYILDKNMMPCRDFLFWLDYQ
ncbi:hypothetical protein PO909_011308 [Leuciscus waleckii]